MTLLFVGLPFLFGVHIRAKPYMLVTEFHGIHGQCVTIGHAAKAFSLEVVEWASILGKCASALAHIHEKGFIHCDLKHNNVILHSTSQSDNEPVIIDFGKMKKIKSVKILKLSSQEQDRYIKYYKHIALEII